MREILLFVIVCVTIPGGAVTTLVNQDMSVIQKLLLSLISASEKAACIARACRKEETLFQLLVEEKTGEDKNAKFAQDFKTLADVLIQETLRHYVGKDFPDLRENILGEESNKFTNQLGE